MTASLVPPRYTDADWRIPPQRQVMGARSVSFAPVDAEPPAGPPPFTGPLLPSEVSVEFDLTGADPELLALLRGDPLPAGRPAADCWKHRSMTGRWMPGCPTCRAHRGLTR